MQAIPFPIKAGRLRCIDMARAAAILLMLEGHFVDVTLAPEWRVQGHAVYEVWLHLRGLAAPLFFTVTGLIFAYLLGGAPEPGFLGVRRVRRGLLRALELVFWGYLLQINLWQMPAVLRGYEDAWMSAFHVLQCIAVGVLALIGVFGLARRVGPWGLASCYLALGLADFLLAMALANHPGHLPAGMPLWLQNAIKGAGSTFPIAPWLGFTFYGAAAGILLRQRGTRDERRLSSKPFFILGLTLSLLGWPLDRLLGALLLDLLGHPASPRFLPDAYHGRIGEILLILGFLIWVENRFRPASRWFETIGRNTFPIYVAHVIILYGGIFGIGLNRLLHHALNPWQAAAGAAIFCVLFAIAAQWIEPFTIRIRRLWHPLRSNA